MMRYDDDMFANNCPYDPSVFTINMSKQHSITDSNQRPIRVFHSILIVVIVVRLLEFQRCQRPVPIVAQLFLVDLLPFICLSDKHLVPNAAGSVLAYQWTPVRCCEVVVSHCCDFCLLCDKRIMDLSYTSKRHVQARLDDMKLASTLQPGMLRTPSPYPRSDRASAVHEERNATIERRRRELADEADSQGQMVTGEWSKRSVSEQIYNRWAGDPLIHPPLSTYDRVPLTKLRHTV